TISNADGIFTYASPSFHHILGYAPEQLIGQPFAALIHPDDLVIVSNELAMQSADPNHVSLIEVRARHQDGSWRVIEASGKRLDDGTIAFSRDVTERKQIETALRAVATGIAANTGDDFLQSLVKYLAAALNVRYALIAEIADPTERRVRTLAFWNNDAPAPNIEYGLTGTPCEHVIEQNALRYYPAGVQATFPDDAILAQLHAESYMGVPLRNSVGEVFGHLAVLDERPMRDAAERRAILQIFAARVGAELERQRAEEKLRASEAHYRSLIENTSDGIAIIAADGAFSYIHPAYERIWGWAATELIGQPFMELIHPDDLALSANNLGRLLTEADATVGAEIRVRHKDGSWRIVDGTAKRLPNGSIVSNSRDVTERHDIEQAVRAVAEGTAAVTGSDFFRSLVKHMAAALRVRYAYVTQSIDTPPHRLRMLACWAGDDFGANHQYALDGTPCERVIVQGELGFYPRGVYARFPRDQGLAGVEGYLGIPLTDASGQVLGNLVIMDDQPMADNLPDNPIVRIFAGRAGAELERQRAEDALRIAELRFRAVFDQPLLSVQICNPDGTMSQWNAATAQHYNILDDQQALTNNVQPLLGGAFAGQAAPIPPVPYDFPDGRRVWAQGFIYPVKDHAGAVREVMIMVQDITTQKEAEETLRRLNEELEERVAQRTGELNATLAQSKRLAAIIESTSDLVARADLQGTMIYMNRAGRRLVGLSDEEDIRRFSIADFYPPQVLPTIQARVGANIAQGIDADLFETLITDRDGRAIPVSLVGIVHRDPDGAPESLSSVIRDISAQKRIEHELKQAKEAAEEANRAKSTFLANMSHEIRTPMNGIIGMTDLLLDTELGPAQRDFVETIRTSGDALITIINDILDFSKIEAGRLDLEAQPLDLRLCVESALDVLAHRAAEKGLDLAVQIDANTPAAIVGDAVRLRQVLVNLLANAVKFTEQGEVVVTVRTEGRGLRT
ncbi:MAG TPA: PAS domain S-box protein, partial [Roseiflexaceae bacterium]